MHTFIISDEKLNNYGGRVMTEGIDFSQYMKNPVVLYMHERGNVIGRALKVYVKDNQLLADIEFDEKDDYANKIKGKVDRGFLNMTSPWLGVKEWSEDEKLMLKGQLTPTVTKSTLKEISIVDVGANDGALKLFDENENEIKLSDLSKNNKINKMSKFITIALALGLTETATEQDITKKIAENKTAFGALEVKLADIETAKKTAETTEAKELMAKAVKLGLIPEAMQEGQVKLFETDHDGQKSIWLAEFAKVEEKEDPETKDNGKTPLSDNVKLFLDNVGKGKKTKEGASVKLSDFTQDELVLMQEKEPNKFNALVNAYEGETF